MNNNGINLEVRVKTGKKKSKVTKIDSGKYEVWLKAKPVKNAANKELIQVLSKHLNIKPYSLRIVSGIKSSRKILKVESQIDKQLTTLRSEFS